MLPGTASAAAAAAAAAAAVHSESGSVAAVAAAASQGAAPGLTSLPLASTLAPGASATQLAQPQLLPQTALSPQLLLPQLSPQLLLPLHAQRLPQAAHQLHAAPLFLAAPTQPQGSPVAAAAAAAAAQASSPQTAAAAAAALGFPHQQAAFAAVASSLSAAAAGGAGGGGCGKGGRASPSSVQHPNSNAAAATRLPLSAAAALPPQFQSTVGAAPTFITSHQPQQPPQSQQAQVQQTQPSQQAQVQARFSHQAQHARLAQTQPSSSVPGWRLFPASNQRRPAGAGPAIQTTAASSQNAADSAAVTVAFLSGSASATTAQSSQTGPSATLLSSPAKTASPPARPTTTTNTTTNTATTTTNTTVGSGAGATTTAGGSLPQSASSHPASPGVAGVANSVSSELADTSGNQTVSVTEASTAALHHSRVGCGPALSSSASLPQSLVHPSATSLSSLGIHASATLDAGTGPGGAGAGSSPVSLSQGTVANSGTSSSGGRIHQGAGLASASRHSRNGGSRAAASRASGSSSSRRSGATASGSRGGGGSRRQTANTGSGGGLRDREGDGANNREGEDIDRDEVVEPEETLTQPRRIPADAFRVPTVPEEDYFSKVPGCYYHFGKREWRVVYRDPQNECKRRQKTHSIKKYGFYAARSKAEDLRIELEKQYGWAQTVPPPKKCDTDITRYINFDRTDKDTSAASTAHAAGSSSTHDGENDDESGGGTAGSSSQAASSTPTGSRTSARRAAKQQRLLLMQEQDGQSGQQQHASDRSSSSKQRVKHDADSCAAGSSSLVSSHCSQAGSNALPNSNAASGTSVGGRGAGGGGWSLRDRGGAKAEQASQQGLAGLDAEAQLAVDATDAPQRRASESASARRKRRTPPGASATETATGQLGGFGGCGEVLRADQTTASVSRSKRKGGGGQGSATESSKAVLGGGAEAGFFSHGAGGVASARRSGRASTFELDRDASSQILNSASASSHSRGSREGLDGAADETADPSSPLDSAQRSSSFMIPDTAAAGFLSGDAPLTPAWMLQQNPPDAEEEDALQTPNNSGSPRSDATADGDRGGPEGASGKMLLGTRQGASELLDLDAFSSAGSNSDAMASSSVGRSSPSALFCLPDLRFMLRCASSASSSRSVGGGIDGGAGGQEEGERTGLSLPRAGSASREDACARGQDSRRRQSSHCSSLRTGTGGGTASVSASGDAGSGLHQRSLMRDSSGRRHGRNVISSECAGSASSAVGDEEEEEDARSAMRLSHATTSAVGASPFTSLLPAAASADSASEEAEGGGASESVDSGASASASEGRSTAGPVSDSVSGAHSASLSSLQDALCNFVDLASFPATPQLSAGHPGVLSLLDASQAMVASSQLAASTEENVNSRTETVSVVAVSEKQGTLGKAVGGGGGCGAEGLSRRMESFLQTTRSASHGRTSGEKHSDETGPGVCIEASVSPGFVHSEGGAMESTSAGGSAKRVSLSALSPLPAIPPAAFFSPSTVALDRDPSPALSFSEDFFGEVTGAGVTTSSSEDRRRAAASSTSCLREDEEAGSVCFASDRRGASSASCGHDVTTVRGVSSPDSPRSGVHHIHVERPVSAADGASLGAQLRALLQGSVGAVGEASKLSGLSASSPRETTSAAFLASEGERLMMSIESPFILGRVEKCASGSVAVSGGGGTSSRSIDGGTSLSAASRVCHGPASGGAESPPTHINAAFIGETGLSPPCFFKLQPAEDSSLLTPLTPPRTLGAGGNPPSPWVPSLGLPSLLHHFSEEPLLSLGSLGWAKLQLQPGAEGIAVAAAGADADSLSGVSPLSAEAECLSSDGGGGASGSAAGTRVAFRSGEWTRSRQSSGDRIFGGGGSDGTASATGEFDSKTNDPYDARVSSTGAETAQRLPNGGSGGGVCGGGEGAVANTFLSRIRRHLLPATRAPGL